MHPGITRVDRDTSVIMVTEDRGNIEEFSIIYMYNLTLSCLDISEFIAQLIRRTVNPENCFHIPKVLLYTFGQILTSQGQHI